MIADNEGKLTELPNASYAGHKFTGWYTAAEGGTKIDENTKFDKDTTVYAQWKQYTITFDAGKGTGAPDRIIGYGNVTLPKKEPTYEDYLFIGWNDGKTIYEAGGTYNLTKDVTLHAAWGSTITFNALGGTGTPDPITEVNGTVVELPNGPTYEKHEFKGWNDGKSIYGAGSKYTVSENVTMYAMWGDPTQYIISFDLDGGTGSFEISKVMKGESYTLPSDIPSKTGYEFGGWSCNDTTYNPGDTIEGISSDMTLKALWTANEYTITYRTDGSVYKTQSYDFGEEVTAPADPAKTGFIFKGWNPSVPATMPAEDVIVNAMWEVKQHTMTFRVDGGVYVTAKYDYGAAITPPADPAKIGHTFEGWNPAVPATMPDGDVTVDAKWTVNQYTITFDTDGGSSINPMTQNYGTDVTAPSDPTKTGYTFKGWNPSIPDTMPAENVTVKAIWEINHYTITFDTDGGSAVSSITLPYGSAVTKPADPTKTGYAFKGWDKTIPAAMPAENVTIKATWQINQYTIAFNTDGGSAVDPIVQDYGTAVTKPANPTKQGYVFVAWDRPVPATMPAENMTINAIWKVETGAEYVIIFEMEGGTGPFSTMRAAEGEDVTLPEDKPVRTGYVFGGWSCNSAIYNPGDTIEGISSDMTLKALWTPVRYTVVFHGEDATDTQEMTYDVAAALKPNAFEKEGFEFRGWSSEEGSKAIAFEDEQEVKNLPYGNDGKCHLYAVWGPKMDIESGEAVKGEDITFGVNSDNVGAVTVTGPDGTEKRLMPDVDYEVVSVFVTATVRTLSAENPNGTYVKIFGTFTEKLSAGEYLIRVYTVDMKMSEGTMEITDPRPDPPTPPEPVPTPTYYEVSYDIAGGSEPGPGTASYDEGTVMEVATYNGHKDGYYFDGWSCGGKTYKAGDEFVVSENMKFTAIWIQNSNPVPEPSENNTGLIVGITVGIIAAVALIGGAVYFVKRK